MSQVPIPATSASPEGRREYATPAPTGGREVLRCVHCCLVQYRTASGDCRRCHRPVDRLPVAACVPVAAVAVDVAPEQPRGLVIAAGYDLPGAVAAAFKLTRTGLGLSQKQCAQKLGCPRTYVSKIENGNATPTIGNLERMLRALGISMYAFIRVVETIQAGRVN